MNAITPTNSLLRNGNKDIHNPVQSKSIIRELPDNYIGKGEVKGFYFKKLFGNEFAYLYEVSDSDGNQRFEVFNRKINVRYSCISYPGSKSFGLWAWSCTTIDKAFERFEKLTKEGF